MSGDTVDDTYFYVNPDTGLISLKRTLENSAISEFQVCIHIVTIRFSVTVRFSVRCNKYRGIYTSNIDLQV